MKNYSGQLVTIDQYVELTKRAGRIGTNLNLIYFQKNISVKKIQGFSI